MNVSSVCMSVSADSDQIYRQNTCEFRFISDERSHLQAGI